MSKNNKLLLFILVFLLIALALSKIFHPSQLKTMLKPQSKDLTLILVTFGSQDQNKKWQGEIAPYMDKLGDIKEISDTIPFCAKSFLGKISDQRVMLVVTGMAKVNASACVQNILQTNSEKIKEVFLSGIAGFSPYYKKANKVNIGDLCINSTAFDFDLQYYGSDQKDSQTKLPNFWKRDIGDSPYISSSSGELSNKLFDVSQNIDWRSNPQTSLHSPKIFGPTECIEASSDLFWHDSQLDKQAREIGSEIINNINKSKTSASDVVIASSMESLAVGATISKWNQANNTNIPFAYVRSASNFDQPNILPSGFTEMDSKSSLEQTFSSDKNRIAFESHAMPVLQLLKSRIQ